MWLYRKSQTQTMAVLLLVCCGGISSVLAEDLPAFPGAAGFGASTPGGRGGKVLFVTNTNDSGPGSLRAACEAEGPRIVVFRVGGTIVLKRDIKITHPYLTIAGQTAPGGGICLRNASANKRAPIILATHDVVIRYLRIRPGKANRESCCLRGLAIVTGAHHVVIDHCSISWSVDELFTVWDGVHDVTLQWCFLTEALHRANHQKGPHSYGALLGDDNSRNFTLHHNLFAHNDQRNPRIKCGGIVDVVNNVVYNFGGSQQNGWGASHVSHGGRANFVKNYVVAGRDSLEKNYWISATGDANYFVEENITPNRRESGTSQSQGVVRPKDQSRIVSRRFEAPVVPTSSPSEAKTAVLKTAGASMKLGVETLWIDCRDAVDRRIAKDLRDGKGRMIDDPSDVGGWPLLEAGDAPTDSDGDGMPDAWEMRYALNPGDPADGRLDANGNGYTNLEEYLNGLNPRS